MVKGRGIDDGRIARMIERLRGGGVGKKNKEPTESEKMEEEQNELDVQRAELEQKERPSECCWDAQNPTDSCMGAV